MAYRHLSDYRRCHCNQQQQDHFSPTPSSCCCRCSCPPPPTCQSPSPSDPLIQALISQLLFQNPQTSHPYSEYLKPYSTNIPFDFTPNLQTFLYQNQTRFPNQKRSTQKQCFGSRQQQHHPNREEDDHSETPYSLLSSLFERIDILESSLRQLSSSASFSVRDAAAHTIQTYFRAYLVRRSRSLHDLKELASIKSSIGSLKSSISRQTHLDFGSLSRKAMHLLLKLDGIQGGDQLVRDSKRTIAQEIAQFLELVDGAYHLERNQVTSRTCKIVRSAGNNSRVMYPKKISQSNVGLKSRNMDKEEKKLIENLKERVERIRGFSRVLEDEEENEELDENDESVGVTLDEMMKRGPQNRNGSSSVNKLRRPPSNATKHVCFVDDKNETRVYSIDGNEHQRELRVTDDKTVAPTQDMEDEEPTESDEEGSSQDSIDGRTHITGQKMDNNNERCGIQYQNREPMFSAPVPAKMETRADLTKKQAGVRILG